MEAKKSSGEATRHPRAEKTAVRPEAADSPGQSPGPPADRPEPQPAPNLPTRITEKRSVDMQIISDWIDPGSRVLDLGCGRGILLEYLMRKKSIFGVGVDVDPQKVLGCLRRGVNAYQGDLHELMRAFPDQSFDRTICSRTLQELNNPAETVLQALRVSRFVTVGFVNYAFWKNRLSLLLSGSRVRNEVYPAEWYRSRTSHPVSVAEFEHFCLVNNIHIVRKVYLAGDWKSRTRFMPNWFCGHAIYDLQK